MIGKVMMTKVIHYSCEEFELDDRGYHQRIDIKPSGLWVTNDNENNWKEWCIAEQFRLERLKYRTEYEISKNANLLILDTNIQFDMFNIKFSKTKYGFNIIDWNEVARNWDGILIPNYFFQRRLDLDCSWYYGWDCASGCIWNTKVLRKVLCELQN